MGRRGSRQPPPAPRKERLRKCIRPTGRVRRKLNFDEENKESISEKRKTPKADQCKSCAVCEDETPVPTRNEEAGGSEREPTKDKCNNQDEPRAKKSRSADKTEQSTS